MREFDTQPEADSQHTTAERELEASYRIVLADFYRAGKPPWDTDIAPPELVHLIEGDEALPPGRALDLGCGTGTNSIYLATRGWEVVGVDLIDEAIAQARKKAEIAEMPLELRQGDVTRLDDIAMPQDRKPYDLFFDLSCYCGIPTHRRDAYAAGVTKRAAPNARLLMFAYGFGVFDDGVTGASDEEMRRRFTGWDLIDVTPGTNPFPTFWFTLQRNTSASPK